MRSLVLLAPLVSLAAATRPNLVILLADDLGYGDLSGYGGHPTSQTPRLDAMQKEGMRFTDFYSASPVCSPSRAGILTGRLMTRSGVWPGVFYPDSIGGMALSEVTLPHVLRASGYDTFATGKWHIGVGEGGKFLPTRRGFDHYLGVPYGVDMCALDGIACFAPNVSCTAAQFVGPYNVFGQCTGFFLLGVQ